MSSQSHIDTCVHQWTLDYERMTEVVPEKWKQKLTIKAKVQDPTAGTLMASIPWYHAYWNEDSPDYERPDSGEYTNSELYSSANQLSEVLSSRNIETALLCGHEILFLPTLMSTEFTAVVASAYNQILKEDWLDQSDRYKGAIVVPMNNPEAAVEEIEKYANDPNFVSVLVLGGWDLPFGHEFLRPVFEAAAEMDIPVTIHTSGNPMHRQTAQGLPEHFATYDANLTQNLMTNLVSMIFQGVFDEHPDLKTVWVGGGVSWVMQTLWRCTRYYRNFEPQVPVILDQEPHTYIDDNIYVSTFPLESLPETSLEALSEMVGLDRVLFGSGYPHWNADSAEEFEGLSGDARQNILTENAATVYNL